MMRLKSDLVESLWAATDANTQTLANIDLQWDRRCALGVVIVARITQTPQKQDKKSMA
jgi:phosphoribosylamine-glycine ligase